MKISPVKQIKDGLIGNNPIFVQFLGMCSALAITTSVTNAIGMGISVTAVLICSNLLISLLRKFIVPQVRIAAYIVIISGFVTAVELLIKAYLPELDKSLGLFIPLIVVNCIILARAEAFASKNGVIASAIDGVAMGLGYTAAVVVTAAVRELLGTGKLLAAADGSGGITILGDWYSPANIFILPPGAFLTLAFLCALFQTLKSRSAKKKPKSKAVAEGEEYSDEDYYDEEYSDEDYAEEDYAEEEYTDDSSAGGEALYAAELAADMAADSLSDEEYTEASEEEYEFVGEEDEYIEESVPVEESAEEWDEEVIPAEGEEYEEYEEIEDYEDVYEDESGEESPADPVPEEEAAISDDFMKNVEEKPAASPKRRGAPVFDFGEADPSSESDEPTFDFSGVFDNEQRNGKGDK